MNRTFKEKLILTFLLLSFLLGGAYFYEKKIKTDDVKGKYYKTSFHKKRFKDILHSAEIIKEDCIIDLENKYREEDNKLIVNPVLLTEAEMEESFEQENQRRTDSGEPVFPNKWSFFASVYMKFYYPYYKNKFNIEPDFKKASIAYKYWKEHKKNEQINEN